MGRTNEYRFALYHDTGYPHSHDSVQESGGGGGGFLTDPAQETGYISPNMSAPANAPPTGGANAPPAGFTLIGPGIASAPNPTTGGVLYMTLDPYTQQWQYQAGATQPPQINVSAGGPSFTGIPEAMLLQSAQAAGGTVQDYGVYKVITYPDGTSVRADPSLGPGGQLYYNVSVAPAASSGGLRQVNSASTGLPSLVTGAGGGAVNQPSSSMPGAFPGTGRQLSYQGTIPQVASYDQDTGATILQNAMFDPGTEAGGILQRDNPRISPAGGISGSYGSTPSFAGMARDLATSRQPGNAGIISGFGGTSTGDPIVDAAGMNYLANRSRDLIARGYTPEQARQFISMEQQVGRSNDPFAVAAASSGASADPWAGKSILGEY